MKKILCFLAIGAMTLTSCSSSDDDNNNADVVLLKQTIETDEFGDTFTSTATYNGTKLNKITADGGYVIQFTYNGDLITKIEYKSNGVLFQTENYTYDSSDRLVTYVMTEIDGSDYGHKETFVHNANGSISVTYYSGTSTSQTTLDGTGTVTFLPNGEVASIVTTMGDSHVYTYDTKNSPFKNVTGYAKISWVDISATGINHNITFDDSTFGDVATTYTYNAANYPTTATESGSGSDQIVTQFIYY